MENKKFLTKKPLTCFKQAITLAGLILSLSANAAIVAYTNKAAFDSAAGSTTLENFHYNNCCQNYTTISSHTVPFIQPGATYSLLNPFPGNYSLFFNGGGGFNGGWLHSIKDNPPDGNSALKVEFDSPISAFGFVTNTYMGGAGFTAKINFTNGSSSVENGSGISTHWDLQYIPNFYGFVSDIAIDSVEIQGNSLFSRHNFAIDNFQFGGAPAAVPIPAAAWLFGSALAGLGVVRRKK